MTLFEMYIIVSSNKFWTGMISPGNSDKNFQDSQKDQNSRNSRMHEYHEIVSRQMSFRVFPKAKRISKTIVSFNLIKHKLISRFHFLRNSSPFRKYRFNRIYSFDTFDWLIPFAYTVTRSAIFERAQNQFVSN